MNFSVGVSMYRLNVTSYWYRLRCSQRKVEANMDIVKVVVIVNAVLLPAWIGLCLANSNGAYKIIVREVRRCNRKANEQV
jgi:hypothetical protein